MGLQWAFTPDPEDPGVIVVDRAALAQAWTEARGRPPAQDELDAAVADWVQTEMLVREARRLGVDAQDPVIRARLASQMATLTQATATPPEPSEAQLRALYAEQAAVFTQAPRVTLRQLPAADAAEAERLAEAWRGGADPRTLSEEMAPGGPVLRGRTPEDLGARYGEGFAEAALSLPLETPTALASDAGWRVISVLERDPGGLIPFEQAEARLRVRWKQAWLQEATEAAVQGLRARYRVFE
ncbi:MAG: peptidyl-prolyl cis-trans isomerase [Alphaproteobacteria bacterium]|nr:peptidyl-prolyl cis-trans isomerase [Alphaproteobacteria bacterium]MCB9795086.1 peptidyl-prolyl cis-trans isomerase [Alphaproteobacteria bacterium]